MKTNLPPALKKEIKGVPVVIWIGLIAAGIALAIYLRKRNDAKDAGFTDTQDLAGEPTIFPDSGTSMAGNSANDYADFSNLVDLFQRNFTNIGNSLNAARKADARRANKQRRFQKKHFRKIERRLPPHPRKRKVALTGGGVAAKR